MEWNSKEFFPTLFYEFNFSEEEIQPLLDEMEEKKKNCQSEILRKEQRSSCREMET